MWQTELHISIFILFFLCIFVFVKGRSLHNNDWLNPLSATVFLTIGVYTLASFIAVAVFVDADSKINESYSAVMWLSSVYLLAIYLGYQTRANPLRHFLSSFLAIYSFKYKEKRSSVVAILIIFVTAILCYLALMALSGAGLLWITDTRTAYQLFRVGVGHWWLMYQWLLIAAFFLALFAHKHKRLPSLGLLSITFIFAFLLNYSGSKAAVLSILVIALLYFHYFVKKIRLHLAFISVFVSISIFLAQLIFSGVYDGVGSAFEYFVDYFYTSALLISHIEEIGHRYGEGLLTSLWFYVPRALFQDKPFEYGVTLIHQSLFPGMAEQSFTPGILPWALSYLDFGIFGVAIEGFFIGSFQRAVYMRFTIKKNMAMFAIMISACYAPVFVYATPIIYLTIALFLSFIKNRFPSKISLSASPT